MKNQNGVALPILIIIIVVIMAIVLILANYAKEILEENELKDLRTNMLLIQAETRKGLEEVCFQTANLDKNKEEDITKINEIKQENLKGKQVQGSEIEKDIPTEITIDENCYYLDEDILNNMGIKNLNSKKYGYFIVRYDFEKTTVEVMNTLGYKGKYTLTQLIEE